MVYGTGQRTEKVSLQVIDIENGTEQGLRVLLEKTGKWTTLPRDKTEVYPGRVVIPIWLAKRILADH